MMMMDHLSDRYCVSELVTKNNKIKIIQYTPVMQTHSANLKVVQHLQIKQN